MENINRNNYELFVIDWIDGNLSTDKISELKQFLLLNPDLEEECAQLENSVLSTSEELSFDNKEFLKKTDEHNTINKKNYTTFFIAYIQNDLNVLQVSELQEFIKLNPDTKKELSQFEATVSIPEKNIVFENKNLLYKRTSYFQLNHFYYAAAALFIIGLFLPTAINFFTLKKVETAINDKRISDLSVQKDTIKKTQVADKIISKKIEHSYIKHTKKALQNKNEKVDNNRHVAGNLTTIQTISNLQLEPITMQSHDVKSIAIADIPIHTQSVEKAEKNISFLSLKEAGIKSIKDVAKEAFISSDTKKTDYDKLHWTDFAGFLIAKINKKTGSKIRIEKQTDSNGNVYAYGLRTKDFGIERK